MRKNICFLIFVLSLAAGLACGPVAKVTPVVTTRPGSSLTPDITEPPDNGPIDPGNVSGLWNSQSCKATIIARKDSVRMEVSGKFENFELDLEKEYMLVVGADLILEGNGKADINYGGGHIVTIFAPANGSGDMKIIEWNGARKISVTAGAGHVVENDSLASCKLTVEAAGQVSLTGIGTEYVFSANPDAPSGETEFQMAVFEGSVEVDEAGGSYQLSENKAARYTNWSLQGISTLEELQMTPQTILQNFDNGYDIYGLQMNNSGILPTEPPGSVTVQILTGWTGQQYDHLMVAVAAYQETHPDASFSVISEPGGNLRESYQTALISGEGPTILIGPSQWGVDLYLQKLAADAEPYMLPEDLKAFQNAALGSINYRGVLTGFPLEMIGVATYRNTQLMPDFPGSFEYLEEVAFSYNSDGIAPLFADVSFFFSGANYISLGGAFMDREGNPTVDTSEDGIAWLELLRRFAAIGPTAFGDDQDRNVFVNRTAAVIFDGSWNWRYYSENLGYDSLVIDPWYSVGDRRLSGFVYTNNGYLNPNAGQRELEAGADFLRYLVSVDGQTILAQAGIVPVRSDIVVNEPYIQQLMAAFEGGTPLPILPQMDQYYMPMDLAIQSYLYEGNEVRSVLKNAQDMIRQALNP